MPVPDKEAAIADRDVRGPGASHAWHERKGGQTQARSLKRVQRENQAEKKPRSTNQGHALNKGVSMRLLRGFCRTLAVKKKQDEIFFQTVYRANLAKEPKEASNGSHPWKV